MQIFRYHSVLHLSCILVMCHLPASGCFFLFRRCAFQNHQRIRLKRQAVPAFVSNSLLRFDVSTRRAIGTMRTQMIGTRKASTASCSCMVSACRNQDYRRSCHGRRPRYFSTSARRSNLSGVALWSSVASHIDLDDEDDRAPSFSLSNPQYVLQIKAYVTKNDGTAIGFYCFEPGNPDFEALGGSAYFALNRSAFEAYYSAILSSLEYIREKNNNVKSVTVQCDHDIVVHQLNGKFDIQRDSLRTLYWKVMELKEACFDDVRFEFIPRSANKEAGDFASKALGSKTLMNYHFDIIDPMLRMGDQAAGASRTQKTTKGSRLSNGSKNMNFTLEIDNESSKEVAPEMSPREKMTTAAAVPMEPMTTPKDDKGAAVMDIFQSIVYHDEIEDDMSSHAPSPSISMRNGPSIYPDHMYSLEFDGGSRGNPSGAAGAGMVLYDTGPSGNEKREVWAGWCFLGEGEMTNNQAEYWGLIVGLEAALERGIRKIQCFGDSNLVVKHITGDYRVRNAKLLPLWKRTKELLQQFDSFEINHIRRHLNSRADALANLAMDSQESGSSD
eukprot:scaffold310_cov168-Amphora_coffeaeformis.AAC.41